MRVVIDDPELDEDAKLLASAWGRPVEEMVQMAMRQTLRRLRIEAPRKIDWDTVYKIQDEVSLLPVLDKRSSDELIGYNDFGHFD